MVRKLNSKRTVLKIGTTTLSKTDGTLDVGYIKKLVDEVASLLKKDKEIILVTSGAIGAGCAELGTKTNVGDIVMRQATAAIGQSKLMHHYNNAFAKHNIKVAQILLTYDDFSNRKSYLNLKNTLDRLLRMDVVTIINENDATSI
jgi:glutamate 5-kinase